MTSQIETQIIALLESSNGEITGSAELISMLNCKNKTWSVKIIRRLEARGDITAVHRVGRGNKKIFKLNRNSAGAPRKRGRHA